MLRRREWDSGHPDPLLSDGTEDSGAMYRNLGIRRQLIHAIDHELSISSPVDKCGTHIVNENEAENLAMTSRILHLLPAYTERRL